MSVDNKIHIRMNCDYNTVYTVTTLGLIFNYISYVLNILYLRVLYMT